MKTTQCNTPYCESKREKPQVHFARCGKAFFRDEDTNKPGIEVLQPDEEIYGKITSNINLVGKDGMLSP